MMTPLTIGGTREPEPTDYPELLQRLSAQPSPALIWYGPDEKRIELSGRVLANWAIKMIGFFEEEVDLGPGQRVLIQSSLHWKAYAAVLAFQALGATVDVAEQSDSSAQAQDSAVAIDADLVLTDTAQPWIDSTAAGTFEVAVFSSAAGLEAGPSTTDNDAENEGSNDSASGPRQSLVLPGWMLDIDADLSMQPDQLRQKLTPQPIPRSSGDTTDTQTAMVLREWSQASVDQVATVWARDNAVVLYPGYADAISWEQMLRNEGLSG